MIHLNLPEFEYKFKNEDGKTYLFDIIRKKYVILTPEEWVRQHFVNYLIQNSYPKSLINIERGHKYHVLKKRTDIIVYDRLGECFLLVECKSVDEKISQSTFDQIARYNLSKKARFIAVTNGLTHYFCEINYEDKTFAFLNYLPPYH